jgi:pimeloyl-ACP methyl ester carboxylesterase
MLLLLHGLGATAGVWSAFTETAATRWPGRWLAPDLPGHGGSAPMPRYDVDDYAQAIAALVAAQDAGPVTVLGHSLGGVIALALASGTYGFRPIRVLGLGIKADWTDEELARMASLASRPPRWFDSEVEAASQHSKIAGLAGVDPGSPLLARGTIVAGRAFRAAIDPAAFAVGAPDLPALAADARCPVHLACGTGDAMVSVERLRAVDPGARAIPDAGHNAMVDAPTHIWDWLETSA